MVVAVPLYFVLGALTLGAVSLVDAPYGRHDRPGWGPRVPSRLAWLVMESPAVFVAAAVFVAQRPQGLVPWVLFAAWQLHYVYRALVFPWRLRTRGKTVPVLIPALAIAFNTFNAWLNMTWIGGAGHYAQTWLVDPRFGLGAALFLVGLATHVRSDQLLRGLRAPGQTGYAVPHGFLFRWVSCPNYLGEIVQWFGWAVMTWSLPGLGFALYTVANLGPRARAHHRWYRHTFADYPPQRRALLPGIW